MLIKELKTSSVSAKDASPKVSVLIITYNQKAFVAQAIDSALMQKINFDYEIVIGEDFSTDGTQDIVKKYASKYPDRIRPLLHNHNLGPPEIHGKNNFVITFKACKGEYIALLDGDDYWTDPNKLQKQTDFMDNHPECAICFHNVTVFDEDGKHKPLTHRPENPKEIFTLEDLLSGNFIHTCSVIFRRGLFGEFPQWFYECKMGDWPLHILNARHGDIGYIDEVMAVYRSQSTGVWSSKNQMENKIDSICAANKIKPALNCRHKKILDHTIIQWCSQIMRDIQILAEKRKFWEASFYAKKCFCRFKFYDKISKKSLAELFLVGYFPKLTYLIIRRSYRKILSIIR